MRILILEDEPLIAMDLEDIVSDGCGAECVLAANVQTGLDRVAEGVDFAFLDFDLGSRSRNSLAVACDLLERHIPFCFVSGSLPSLPEAFRDIPRIAKPFRPSEIRRILPA
jgi:DNA-binding LytR/AlgR family response regulator